MSSSSPRPSLPTVRSIHFIGICGTAMGSVAAMLREDGFEVTGSDQNVYPPMSTFLEERGIPIHEGYRAQNLSHGPDLVVVGNAISRGNPELEAALDERLYSLSLPETLKMFYLRHTHNLVVAGTHGKTTTASLLAWIFQHAGKEPSYLIGGIALSLGQGCKRQSGSHFILEGDEYDTAYFDKRSKFLHYLPELAIVNNIEFDHADIFDSLDAIKLSFTRLLQLIPSGGMALINADSPHARDIAHSAHCQILEVGFSENAALPIGPPRATAEGTHFRFIEHDMFIPMHGRHNVSNAAMAAAAAHFYQIPLPTIAEALSRFQGVKRRMEIRAEVRGITIVDDFAHHPTALRETIQALRLKFPNRRLWALFEPRSNTTRRATFQKELPAALAEADAVCIAQVAGLDQLPEGNRLDPERVMADIRATGTPAYYEPDVDAILARLKPELKEGDVVAVFSNGGFGGIHTRLAQSL